MSKTSNPFLDFLKTGTSSSMGRLIVFICTWAAVAATLGAIIALFMGKFDVTYAGFVLSLWAAAIGGKTWAKSVELKNKEHETFKEPKPQGGDEIEHSKSLGD